MMPLLLGAAMRLEQAAQSISWAWTRRFRASIRQRVSTVYMSACLDSKKKKDPPRRMIRAGQFLAVGSTMVSASMFLLVRGYGQRLIDPFISVGGTMLLGGWALLGRDALLDESSDTVVMMGPPQ